MKSNHIIWDDEAKLHVNIFHNENGELYPYLIFNHPIAKQLAAYTSIYKDLTECKNSISYLKSIIPNIEIPLDIKHSLLFASIVKYAKCFTNGEGRGTSLNKKDVFKEKIEEQRDFHNDVMDIRNKYLAHAGNTAHESRAIVVVLNPNKNNKRIEKTIYAGFKLKDDDSNIENYIKLIDSVLKHVEEKMKKSRVVMHQKIDEIDIDVFYNTSKMPNKDEMIPFNINEIKK